MREPSGRDIVVGLRLDHFKIDVADLDRSLAFYRGALGFRTVSRFVVPRGTILKLSPDGRPPALELHHTRGRRPRAPRAIHIGISVSDVVRTVRRLRRRGVDIRAEPKQIGCEIIAFVSDPDGHLIELLEPIRGRETTPRA